MKSILSFNHYDVLETVYKFNPFADDENYELTPRFDVKIKYKDESKTVTGIIFTIEIGSSELIENPLYVKASVLGMFEIETDEDVSDKLINDLYKKNALAIIFPYVRSLVVDLTSRGSEMPITLPPINIAALIEHRDLITESIDEE